MNLKIFCEASVDLIDYNKLESINYVVKEYDMRDETLSGFVTLNGNYSNKNNERCDYVQDVPFTVMFKNDNYNIDNVMLDNFNYYEVVNNGIVCSFDLLIDYNMNIDESQIPNVLYNDESDFEISKQEEITDNLSNENIVDKEFHIEEKENNDIHNENVLSQENIANDINDDLDNDINEINIFDDSESDIDSDINLEKTIKDKYNKLLDNIFNNRSDLMVDDEEKTSFEDNNSLEETKHNQININESKSVKENKFGFLKFLDSKTTLRVYYPEKESDIDGICKKENINVLDIYNESYNKDFSDKRRIIIEK